MFKLNKYFILYITLLIFLGFKGMLFLAFIIALFHEMIHFITARRLGFKGFDIEFLPLGTALFMKDLDEASPKEDLLISLSGPLFNIVLGLIFYLVNINFSNKYLDLLIFGNFSMGFFNLIPALPLDGGRILRAILSYKTYYKRANKITVNVGMALGALMTFSYLVLFIKGKNNFNLGLIALYIIITSLKEKERIAYIIMGDIIRKRFKFVNKGYMENKSISVYYKSYLINLMTYIDKNKYNIFMILDENMKLLDIMYEEDVIEALRIYGNLSLEEYLDIENKEDK